MIVKRTWISVKYGIVGYRKIVHHWQGFYLFGIIPFYLENYKTEYVS